MRSCPADEQNILAAKDVSPWSSNRSSGILWTRLVICVLLYLIISGLLVRLILLLVTSILTNQEAVLRRFVLTIYDYFMQQQGIFKTTNLLCQGWL
jgi:hypothetical protein